MPVPYVGVPDAASRRQRLEALAVARTALQAPGPRRVLAVVLGPAQPSLTPSDNAVMTLDSREATNLVEWPAAIGTPASWSEAIRLGLIAWVNAEIAAERAALAALGVDLTGAPA